MKKAEKVVIKIYLIVIAIILIGCFAIWKYLSPPSVKSSEKKIITTYVEKYLSEKYGEHNFKFVQIDYDFPTSTSFGNNDYSNPLGYTVFYKTDTVKYFSVHIVGVYPNEYKISSDSFIGEYYFGELGFYERQNIEESIKPVNKMKEYLFNKINQEFEENSKLIESCNIERKIPNNLGRIPTMEELKNNINFYEIRDFKYSLTGKIENEEEYKSKLSNYLSQNFGGEWSVCVYPSKTDVSCTRKV